VADPGFVKGGSDYGEGERAELETPRETEQGSGAGAQQGPGAELVRVRSSLKLKAFRPFSYKKWPKIKDLNEKLPQGLRQTPLCSHDQP